MTRHLALVLGAVLLAACASMQNTPQQDYVWTCVEACKTQIPPQCRVTRVDTAGRYYGSCTGTLANWDKDFTSCMREQYQAHPYREWLKANGR
jgi:hypothetical protein